MKNIPAKAKTVMKEFGKNQLHAGSKEGPKVKDARVAFAIAMSEAGKSRKSK